MFMGTCLLPATLPGKERGKELPRISMHCSLRQRAFLLLNNSLWSLSFCMWYLSRYQPAAEQRAPS